MSVFRRVLAMCVFAWGVCAQAVAQDGEYTARASVSRAGLVATHGEDPTASGTALDVQDRLATPRSLGDVVREAPGTQVRSSGGLGGFSTLSLRGADGQEALVVLDEIPLLTPDGGPFDLSSYPVELFERVDVFRGGAPVWLGSGAIAGVVRLVPRRGHVAAWDGSASAGSFDTWQLQAGQAAGEPALTVRSRAVVRGSSSDYPYIDDRGTRFEASDDRELRRKNAQLADTSGYLDLAGTLFGGRWHAIVLAQGRVAGEPGPGSQPTPNIHRNRVQSLCGAAFERTWRGWQRLQLVVAFSYARDRYTDLFGELGLSRRWNTRDDAYRGFVRAADSLRISSWLDATLVGSYALDQYVGQDAFTFPKPAPSTRHDAAAALELAAHAAIDSVTFELRPSARIEWSHSALHADRSLSGPFDSTHSVTAPTLRLGAGVSPLAGLAFTASVAMGMRLPTLFELFGDRGLVLPAPDLEPVRSTTLDAGITVRHAYGRSAGMLELRAFQAQRRDEITSYRTAQHQLGHVNLSEVEQRGLELGASGSLRDSFHLHAAVTYLTTQDALDKRLPLCPKWNAFVRPELRVRFASTVASSAGISGELAYRSFVFADRANLAVIPACTTAAVNIAFGFLRDRLGVVLRVDDIADARCTDLVGFPLPGRSVRLSLTYREKIQDHA